MESFAETYGTPVGGLTVEDKETNLKISGGIFNDIVIGGGGAAGSGNTSTVVTSNLEITGGTFGSKTSSTNIFAGGAAFDSGTATINESNLTIDGSDKNLNLLFANNGIYAGGLNSGVSKKTTLTLKNLTEDMFGIKAGIYGGSRAESTGVSIEDGDTEINISNSYLYADVYGGGRSSGAGSILKAGKSKITVSNTSVSGYENTGTTWTGRIFGAGYIRGGSLYEQKSTEVVINNVIGVTYDKESEEISNSEGARVYGGGYNFKDGTEDKAQLKSRFY